jgi:hypothetical protein
MFDAQGEARGGIRIFQFGDYNLMASGSFGTVQRSFTVGPAERPCP